MNWWHRGIQAIIVCSLLLFAAPRSAAAQEESAKPAGAAAQTAGQALLPSEKLRAHFFMTLQLVFQERYADAGDEIHKLIDEGRDFGYRSFPEFSRELLLEAKKEQNKNPELSAFFVRQALLLSPNDLSVALSAFAFSDVVEKHLLWKSFQEALWPSLKRPMMFMPVAINLAVLLLSALTIASLIGGFVQLLRHGDLVFRYITRFIPRNYRGAFGPVAVLLALALPLLWGPGIAAACWAVILGRSIGHCRSLTVLVGMLLIAWMVVIQNALPFKARMNSEVSQVVDGINASALMPKAEKVLREAFANDPQSAILAMSLARVVLFEGKFDEGEQLLKTADRLAGNSGEISRVARLNLAVIAIRAKHWDEARMLLEQDEALGGGRFEVLYNLALVHLNQLDIEQYRSYYTRAQEFDRKEWQRLDSEQGEQHLPVWSSLHTIGFLAGYLRLPIEAADKEFPAVERSSVQLSSSLVRGASPGRLGVIGLLLIGLAFLRRSESGRIWMEQHRSLQDTGHAPKESSLLWSLLPGGVFLAGKRPVLGVCFAALCFAVAFIMTGWPLHFMPVSLYPLSIQKHAFSSFIIAYGVGFIVPVLCAQFSRSRPAGAQIR